MTHNPPVMNSVRKIRLKLTRALWQAEWLPAVLPPNSPQSVRDEWQGAIADAKKLLARLEGRE